MKNEKILIVEDEMVISSIIEETLNSLGYNRVEAAYNITKAGELLRKNNYDIVLMDVNLGGEKDGIDLVTEIKSTKELAVIYVTGNSDARTLDKAKVSMPYGFITKPITENELRVQLELTLYKERVKKMEAEEDDKHTNLYEGDCNGLKITLNREGKVLSASAVIRKITGKPSYNYINKRIQEAGFERDFYDLLKRTLTAIKRSDLREHYGEIHSPFLGTRYFNIQPVDRGFYSYTLNFTDLTNTLHQKEQKSPTVNVAIASANKNIINGFKAIPSFIGNTRIAAEITDLPSLENFLESNASGLLMIDMAIGDIAPILERNIQRGSARKIKILLMTSLFGIRRLRSITEECYDGYVSLTASDMILKEAFEALMSNKRYMDTPLLELHK